MPRQDAVIRVMLPAHLWRLARTSDEVELTIVGPVSIRSVLDALEAQYPALSGTLRDHATGNRRPLVRFFACRRDLSHDSMDALLPEAVVRGEEPLCIVGAIAGG